MNTYMWALDGVWWNKQVGEGGHLGKGFPHGSSHCQLMGCVTLAVPWERRWEKPSATCIRMSTQCKYCSTCCSCLLCAFNVCSLKRFWCVHASILSTLIDKHLSARQLIVQSSHIAFVCNQSAVRNRWNLLVIHKLWSQSYSSVIVLTIPSAYETAPTSKLAVSMCMRQNILCTCVPSYIQAHSVSTSVHTQGLLEPYLMMVLAPLDTSSLAIFTWPLVTASCSGVSFSNPGTFTRAPWSRSKEATSM